LTGDNGVKCAEDVQLAAVVRGRIAQDSNLDIHMGTARTPLTLIDLASGGGRIQ
jgi:hypothetical protein